MDWRLFSAVTLAGASFSMVAFGAYTLRADSIPRDAGRSLPPLVAPGLTPIDVSDAAVAAQQNRSVSFVPVALNDAKPGDAAATPAAEYPVHSGILAATAEGASSPVLVADLPVQQDKVAGSWHRRHHVTWRRGHHARPCTVLRPCETDRKQQVAAKHDDGHAGPKVALILGVSF